jgi:hypothetical protein
LFQTGKEKAPAKLAKEQESESEDSDETDVEGEEDAGETATGSPLGENINSW